MPLKITHPWHTQVMGTGLVLISSPPVKGPRRDFFTGQIVEEAALLSRSWAIIAKDVKQYQEEDKARQVGSDFDKAVQGFVGEYGIMCIIMIVGTSDPGIMIKAHPDDSTSEEILEIIRSGLEPHFNTKVTNPEDEDASSQVLPILRLEMGPDERGFMKDQFVNSIADIVGLINARLGFSESNESSGSVLD